MAGRPARRRRNACYPANAFSRRARSGFFCPAARAGYTVPTPARRRVLYRVYEADENDAGRVEIIALRHAAQKPLTRSEGRDIDAANR